MPKNPQEIQSVFVYKIENKDKKEKIKKYLEEKGFEFFNTPHASFSAKKDNLSIVLYNSNKLVLQGKGAKEFIEFYLEPQILENFLTTYGPVLKQENYKDHIGVDESGKGDYFGPLVIASAFVEKKQVSELIKMGVKDSKKMSDKKILKILPAIKKNIKNSIVTIGPERYNQLYEKMTNLNRILAWGHARAIENLLTKTECTYVILDKFTNTNMVNEALMKRAQRVKIEQRTGAEEDIAVATASVLARGEFLEKLSQLGKEFKMELPKGAGEKVEKAATQLINRDSVSVLTKVAKLHFKTTKKIIMA